MYYSKGNSLRLGLLDVGLMSMRGLEAPHVAHQTGLPLSSTAICRPSADSWPRAVVSAPVVVENAIEIRRMNTSMGHHTSVIAFTRVLYPSSQERTHGMKEEGASTTAMSGDWSLPRRSYHRFLCLVKARTVVTGEAAS